MRFNRKKILANDRAYRFARSYLYSLFRIVYPLKTRKKYAYFVFYIVRRFIICSKKYPSLNMNMSQFKII